MTLEQFVSEWNEKYNDTIIASQVKCIRGVNRLDGYSPCGRSGEDLIVPDDIWGSIKCPIHEDYWIATPRSRNASYR